ncbi:MAG: glycine cleavage system protein H [Candidatus Fischerbacteria bacterium RBG_13_37_8]|uniref:Glycine cleavage system H protein n=1 Tax=Candidatus Fischerbacteria bacterium RBG_13_37_8 TaxID=1817863 RepID=A0A1F5VWA0_9BACT|nr:MAG: glycine cleavage system protein H [Candidatus Fischerbacteria bacterium RBG_13_37_8]
MEYPDDFYYTKDHEWIKTQANIGTVGITEYAQKQLGDIVYIELPEPGETFEAGDPIGSIESVKAVSEVFCPVSGEITEVNEKVAAEPEIVNADAHGAGWLIKIKIKEKSELDELMDSDEYMELIEETE